MGIPGSANPMLFGGTAAYQINQSLRFDGSSWLARTNSTDTNRKTWTLSYWVKKSAVSSEGAPFSAYENDNNRFVCKFRSGDDFEIEEVGAGAVKERLRTNALHRDASAWYHIVIVYDVTNGTAADRLRIYRNGARDTALNSTVDTYDWAGVVNGAGTQLNFGRQNFSSPLAYFNGYIAEAYLVDGTALTPSSFGETDTITGAWIPKKYSGSYGTNGFYLKFDPTATNGIGHDHSGNGNNFTATGFSTSGTGTDVMSDTPTNNYATLNPLVPCGGTFSEGNLKWVTPSTTSYVAALSSIGLTGVGKVYFEATAESKTGQYWNVGLHSVFNSSSLRCQYRSDGAIEVDGTQYTGYSTYTAGDIIGVTFDSSTGDVSFYKNNSLVNTRTVSSLTVPWFFSTLVSDNSGSNNATYVVNFGQRAFAYTPPTGYKALNTANLPEPTIKKGSEYFDTKLFTAGTTTVTGYEFQPDLVWVKNRNQAYDHRLIDAVRGVQKDLASNESYAEQNRSNSLLTFTSDGFTHGSFGSGSGDAFVGWAWDANGSGSSNTAGSITSTVSANLDAGFSIVTYTGTGANATVGHGLGVAPKMVIVKSRTQTGSQWVIYNSNLTDASYYLLLNTADGQQQQANVWNSTAPTSTVFSVGTAQNSNKLNENLVAYCFSEVAGYSKFGSYVGNGSTTDGPFIWCGFTPRFILVKWYKDVSSAESWMIYDTARSPYNAANTVLYPDSATTEESPADRYIDILSNGFKPRQNGQQMNRSGASYIFAAFASTPFKYANAR